MINKIPENASSDFFPIMQDIFDYSGAIAVNIKKQDLDDARLDLEKYQKRFRDLNSLIIRFDMNESELAEFSRNAKHQMAILMQFIDTSDSLQSLKKLEIQYHEENDEKALTSIQLQGEALKEKIQLLNNQYKEVSVSLTNKTVSKELDVNQIHHGVSAIEAYTQDIPDYEKARDWNNSPVSSTKSRIFLLVQPKNTVYGDILDIFGFVSADTVTRQRVSVMIDNFQVLENLTDDTGLFRIPYEIRQISAGNHSVIGVFQELHSSPVLFHVSKSNSTLTLSLNAVKNKPEITINGFLTAQKPVIGTQVFIRVDNQIWETANTDNSGKYSTNLSFPSGTYLVSTLFRNESLPLHESYSQEYRVVSTGTIITSIVTVQHVRKEPMWLVLPFFMILVSIFGVYLWKKGLIGEITRMGKRDSIPAAGVSAEYLALNHAARDEQVVINHPAQEYCISRNIEGFPADSDRELSLVSMRAYLVYIQLVKRIEKFINAPSLRNLTPRELSRYVRNNTSDTQIADSLSRSVRKYEIIRYGGFHRESDLDSFTLSVEEISDICKGGSGESEDEE